MTAIYIYMLFPYKKKAFFTDVATNNLPETKKTEVKTKKYL